MLLASFAVSVPSAALGEVPAKKQLTRYTVTDLGPTPFAFPGINNRGLVAGTALLADGVTLNAFLWQKGMRIDLGTLGGPNSAAFSRLNERGQVSGNVETATPDPLGEDFCAYGTHLICLAFVWQNGTMTPLATLGGNNSWATGGANNRGQVAGFAENATPDPTCGVPSLEGKPVIWTNGTAWELPTLPGDPDGTVFAINERGQAAGVSSDCGASPTIFHAVLWSEDGSVTDLGNLGGTLNNVAQDINNHGQVVGFSGLPGNTGAYHAFLWTARDGMRDLGASPSGTDLFASAAFGINDNGQVVGWACDQTPDCGGWIWQDGVMTDLTSTLPQGSPWNVIAGTSINSRGEIAALGDINGATHALLLTPCNEEPVLDKGCTGKISAESEIPCDAAHPDIDGCDYRLVDAKAATAAQAVRGARGSKLSAARQAGGPLSGEGALPAARESPPARQLLLQRLGFARFTGSVFPVTSDPALSSGPGATLSPASLTFSTQAVGTTSKAETVALKNTGTTSLTISSIAITGTDHADFTQTHTCGSSLAAGASCGISIEFSPTASGTRTAILSVTDNAAGSPQNLSLAGIGTTARLSPSSLNFGGVGIGATSPAQIVTLTNVGTATLTITGIAITGTDAADFAHYHSCASSLAAGASCIIRVTFKPTALSTRTAILNVTDNAPGSPQKVSLAGVGTTARLTPTSLYFAPVPVGTTSPAQIVTLTNMGTTTLTITGIAITGTDAAYFAQTHNCASSLAAGASCSVSVTFKPQATGLRNAALSVSSNASGSPQTVSLCGGCIPPYHPCYGPGPNLNRCCSAPYPHHSYCSNATGWGLCVES
jgi:probable HAF family extracellular repeat protein